MQQKSKKHFNKNNARNIFDRASKKVAQKTIYSVKKNGEFFEIVDYRNNKPVIVDLPGATVSSKLCDRLNNGKNLPGKEFDRVLNEYHKHYIDHQTYQHIIVTSDDSIRQKIMLDRADLSYRRMKRVKAELLDCC